MTKKLPRISLWLMGFLLFLAVFRDVLANGRPLYCEIAGEKYWPGLRSVFYDEHTPYKADTLFKLQFQVNQFEVWKNPQNFDKPPIYAPIPFSPGERSTANESARSKPGTHHEGLDPRFVHWLGTETNGRDIAATVISGARIAVLTGSLAMAVALSIGLSLGMIAGFFGDDRLRVKRGQIFFFFLSLPIAWFYGVTVRTYSLSVAKVPIELYKTIGIFIAIVFIFNRVGRLFQRFSWFGKSFVFPADLVVMRIAEVFSAIPRLILIIVLAVALRGMLGESIWLMIALIGALGWTGVAKLLRAELLRVRALDYVVAARGLGLPEWRILMRHALPNTLRPIYVAVAFGAAGAVLLEAYLSFLGYGGQSFRGISWGSLFSNENSAANPLDTWWVTFFPGLMIFITVLSLNRIGDALSERY